MAYEEQSPEEVLEELPYKIIPGEVATYRDSIFLERAVVGERLRVAMGMSLRKITEHAPISKGVEQYYRRKILRTAAYQCDQIRLQCLSGEESHDNRRMSGLSGTSMRGGLSEEGCPYGRWKISY